MRRAELRQDARSERLMSLAASVASRRAAGAVEVAAIVDGLDWELLTDRLRARKLLATLGPRIVELAGEHAEQRFVESVANAVELGRRQSALLELTSLRIVAMLAERGIRSSALKGPLLSEAIYGDPGRRLSSDVDLLVPASRLTEAVEVVARLGYGQPEDHVGRDGLPLLHFRLDHERGELPPVELHWRVHWYETRFAEARLLPASPSPSPWRANLADELAGLLLFYARDGFIDLRLATDIGAWWDAFGSALEPGSLGLVAVSFPALAHALAAAAIAAERVVGIPGRMQLGTTSRPKMRVRLAARLANPHPSSSPSQLYADMGFIDGLLSPAGGIPAFVRRQLLPPSEVLDEQARHGERSRARSRLARFMGVLGRYLMVAARLLVATVPFRRSQAERLAS